MNEFEELTLLAELSDSTCELNHGGYSGSNIAVDYLVIPIGNEFLTIPICKECLDGLSNSEWVLFYCLHCLNSQWKIRELLKVTVPEGVVQLINYCPRCQHEST